MLVVLVLMIVLGWTSDVRIHVVGYPRWWLWSFVATSGLVLFSNFVAFLKAWVGSCLFIQVVSGE